MKKKLFSTLTAFLLCTTMIAAAQFTGTFFDVDGAELTIQMSADGRIQGRISAGNNADYFVAEATGDTFAGVLYVRGEQHTIAGRLSGDGIELTQTDLRNPRGVRFRRASAGVRNEPAVAGPATPPPLPQSGQRPPPIPTQAPKRHVIVNDQQLSDPVVAAFEQQFRSRFPDGNYWYDPYCGAWGYKGGPTVSFLPASLRLGGPLKADASGRTMTRIFINGREAHPADVVALQTLIKMVIPPGRYFIDAYGNAGYEGGPPTGNLLVAAQQARSKNGGAGGSGLLDIGVGGDGQTSYYIDRSGSSAISN